MNPKESVPYQSLKFFESDNFTAKVFTDFQREMVSCLLGSRSSFKQQDRYNKMFLLMYPRKFAAFFSSMSRTDLS